MQYQTNFQSKKSIFARFGLFLSLTAIFVSSCVTYTPSAKKKAATTTKPKEENTTQVSVPPITTKGIINIVDFGAKPNDNIDDSPAIQAALTAANKAGTKVVRIPLGVFNIEKSAVNIYGNVRLVGDTLANGTRPTFESSATQNNGFFLGYAYDYDNFSIENLNFSLTGKQLAKNFTALNFSNSGTLDWKARHVSVKNCTFGSSFNAILSSRNSETVTNCVFNGSISGIRLVGTRNTTISHNRFLNNTGGCLLFSNRDAAMPGGKQDAIVNSNITITNNFFDKPVHSYPIHLGTEGAKTQNGIETKNDAPYKNVVIANNMVMGLYQLSGRDSIPIEYARCGMDCGGKNCNVDKDGTADQISVHQNTEGLILFNNTTLFSGDMGITLYECSNALVASNVSRRNTASGIIIHGSQNLTIANNDFSDNGQNEYQNIDAKNRCASFFARAGLCIAALHTQSSKDITLYENRYDISKKKLQKYNVSIVDKGLTNINIQEKEVTTSEIETQNTKMPVKLARTAKSSPAFIADKPTMNVATQSHIIEVATPKTILTFTHQSGNNDIYTNAYFIRSQNTSTVGLRILSPIDNKPFTINGQANYNITVTQSGILFYYDKQTQSYKVLKGR